jgi:hypothetical protein
MVAMLKIGGKLGKLNIEEVKLYPSFKIRHFCIS